jgi:hypothetical protein
MLQCDRRVLAEREYPPPPMDMHYQRQCRERGNFICDVNDGLSSSYECSEEWAASDSAVSVAENGLMAEMRCQFGILVERTNPMTKNLPNATRRVCWLGH